MISVSSLLAHVERISFTKQALKKLELSVVFLIFFSPGISLISAVVRLVPRNMEPESQKFLDYFESKDRKGAKCDVRFNSKNIFGKNESFNKKINK